MSDPNGRTLCFNTYSTTLTLIGYQEVKPARELESCISSGCSYNLDVTRLNKQIDFFNFLMYNYIKIRNRNEADKNGKIFRRKI